MDILYISQQAKKALGQYCDEELLNFVITHFVGNGNLIEMQDHNPTSCRWIITDYITNHTIDSRNKLSVILSMAATGVTIQIGDRQEFGDVNVLYMLKELYYITDEDFDYFVEAFCNFSRGEGVKFLMLEV